jgi:hypothetical protein
MLPYFCYSNDEGKFKSRKSKDFNLMMLPGIQENRQHLRDAALLLLNVKSTGEMGPPPPKSLPNRYRTKKNVLKQTQFPVTD